MVNGKMLYCKPNRRVQLNGTSHFIGLFIWIIILQMPSLWNIDVRMLFRFRLYVRLFDKAINKHHYSIKVKLILLHTTVKIYSVYIYWHIV